MVMIQVGSGEEDQELNNGNYHHLSKCTKCKKEKRSLSSSTRIQALVPTTIDSPKQRLLASRQTHGSSDW
jgi:hypothetical protein